MFESYLRAFALHWRAASQSAAGHQACSLLLQPVRPIIYSGNLSETLRFGRVQQLSEFASQDLQPEGCTFPELGRKLDP